MPPERQGLSALVNEFSILLKDQIPASCRNGLRRLQSSIEMENNRLEPETNEVAAYQASLDYIYSFVDYSLTRGLKFTPDQFDLSRVRALLDLLGNPQQDYPIIHVAGTKGKGSVAAICASVLRAAGYRTGLYTSPHLQDYVERIQVDGQSIPYRDFIDLIEEIKPAVAKIEQLTTFEITTALGFLYFSRQKVGVAVVEVGLGGRLDATNVINPLLSVITSLSMDHMAVLGDTLEKIAAEKAGIIKPGCPVVSAPQKEEARQVIERIAAEKNAPLIQVGTHYFFSPVSHSLDGQKFHLWKAEDQSRMDEMIENGHVPGWEPTCLALPLLGYHQIVNGTTAYAALEVARHAGLVISDEAIHKGFAEVVWPGRFEILNRNPLLIVDSAHNPDSALKLRLALDDYLPGKPVILIFGASEDKDVWGMFHELLPRVKRVIATQSIHPRAMDVEKIISMAHRFGCPAKSIVPLEGALEEAVELAGDEAAVVVTGSLFVAAAARHAWFERGTIQ